MRKLLHQTNLHSSSVYHEYNSGESVTNQREVNHSPENFRLYQNFPQTFYKVTRVGFEIPKTTKVKLGIFNVFGKEICILIDEILQAGNYEVVFDASNFKLEPGILMYKIKTEEFADTKKMFLLKDNNSVS